MPHCPMCGLEPADGRSRCPIDNAFLHSLYCGMCGGEVGWRDLYCGWCGHGVERDASQEIVPLEYPTFSRLALSHAVDGLFVLAMAPVLFSFVPEIASLGSLPICLPMLWVYWVWLWSGGRQSLGQFVFRLISLNEQRFPLQVGEVAYSLSLGLIPRLRRSPRLIIWRFQDTSTGSTP